MPGIGVKMQVMEDVRAVCVPPSFTELEPVLELLRDAAARAGALHAQEFSMQRGQERAELRIPGCC